MSSLFLNLCAVAKPSTIKKLKRKSPTAHHPPKRSCETCWMITVNTCARGLTSAFARKPFCGALSTLKLNLPHLSFINYLMSCVASADQAPDVTLSNLSPTATLTKSGTTSADDAMVSILTGEKLYTGTLKVIFISQRQSVPVLRPTV